MGKLRWTFVLAAAGWLLARGGQFSGSGGSTTSHEPIVVDLVGTFSGQNADLGAWPWDGAKLAVDHANEAGGVDGRKVTLQRYDDQGQPTVGADLAQRAVGEWATPVYTSIGVFPDTITWLT